MARHLSRVVVRGCRESRLCRRRERSRRIIDVMDGLLQTVVGGGRQRPGKIGGCRHRRASGNIVVGRQGRHRCNPILFDSARVFLHFSSKQAIMVMGADEGFVFGFGRL